MSTGSIITKRPVTVVVKDTSGNRTNHQDARGYHIDATEVLHILGEKGNIASHARGYWSSVVIVVEPPAGLSPSGWETASRTTRR